MKLIKYIIPFFLLTIGISSCDNNDSEEPKQEAFKADLLIGEWTIKEVLKENGKTAPSVGDGSFIFDDKTIRINLKRIPGVTKGEALPYKLEGKTISNVGDFNITFDITSLTEDNLVLKSDIRGMKFQFELEK